MYINLKGDSVIVTERAGWWEPEIFCGRKSIMYNIIYLRLTRPDDHAVEATVIMISMVNN